MTLKLCSVRLWKDISKSEIKDTHKQVTNWYTIYYFTHGATTPPLPVGKGLLIIEASRSHSDTPHSVGLLWPRDRPVVVTST